MRMGAAETQPMRASAHTHTHTHGHTNTDTHTHPMKKHDICGQQINVVTNVQGPAHRIAGSGCLMEGGGAIPVARIHRAAHADEGGD